MLLKKINIIKLLLATFNWAAKIDFIALKAEVGNLDINNLVIVPTGWIIFKQN